jgi:transposase
VDIEQSYEGRIGDHGGRGAVVRVERRRRWSDEEKLAILKETTTPGAIIAAVARRHGIGTGQLYTWRRQLLAGAMAGFLPVELAKAPPLPERSADGSRIEISSRAGLMVTVDALVDRDALKLVLEVVRDLDH